MNFLISIICAIIPACLTHYFYKRQNIPLKMSRIEKVYFPVYIAMEKYFYRYSDDSDFLMMTHKIKKIIDDNRMIAGNLLYSSFYNFYSNMNQKTYNKLCNRILIDYNDLLHSVGLPKIYPGYRRKHHMFDKFGIIKYYFNLSFTSFVFFTLYFFFIYVYFFLKKYFSGYFLEETLLQRR